MYKCVHTNTHVPSHTHTYTKAFLKHPPVIRLGSNMNRKERRAKSPAYKWFIPRFNKLNLIANSAPRLSLARNGGFAICLSWTGDFCTLSVKLSVIQVAIVYLPGEDCTGESGPKKGIVQGSKLVLDGSRSLGFCHLPFLVPSRCPAFRTSVFLPSLWDPITSHKPDCL